MAVFSVIVLIFSLPDKMPPFNDYALPLFACSIFYIFGQFFLFEALKLSQPSRVSPLLGMKVFILAIIGYLFLNQQFGIYQWLAIALSTVAAFLLSNTGGKIGFKGFLMILAACLFYSISDLNIKIMVSKFQHLGLLKSILISASISYILCGIFALIAMAFITGQMTIRQWTFSVPFSVFWFAAMLSLFACFALVGVVYGNIIQSTRGILSICFGFILAHSGFEFLDTKISRKVFIQRLLAAILMMAAIGLFYLQK